MVFAGFGRAIFMFMAFYGLLCRGTYSPWLMFLSFSITVF